MLLLMFFARSGVSALSVITVTACTILMSVWYSLQDVCGHLLMCGDTEVVEKLLSHHTLSKMWPLVLLHVWKNFSDRDEIFVVVSFVIAQCKVCILGAVNMFNMINSLAVQLLYSYVLVYELFPAG